MILWHVTTFTCLARWPSSPVETRLASLRLQHCDRHWVSPMAQAAESAVARPSRRKFWNLKNKPQRFSHSLESTLPAQPTLNHAFLLVMTQCLYSPPSWCPRVQHSMLAGDIVVSVETSNSCGKKVLQGTAEVAQLPPLMFLLAGTWHGPAAVRTVWESTDAIYSQFMASLSSRSSRTTQKRRRFLWRKN